MPSYILMLPTSCVTHTHTQTHTDTRTHAHTHMHTQTHMHAHTDTDTHMHAHRHRHRYRHIHTHTHIHTDTHIHADTDTHTYGLSGVNFLFLRLLRGYSKKIMIGDRALIPVVKEKHNNNQCGQVTVSLTTDLLLP